MLVTYRPPARIPAAWLAPEATPEVGAPATVPIPFLDEDEATLAAAALEPLLSAAQLAPAQLRRVTLSSRTGSGFGPLLAAVLGIPPERVEEAVALLYGAPSFPNPGEGPVLHVHVDAPRPGRVPPGGPGPGAFATARLTGPGIAGGPTREVPVEPWTPDRELVERLARLEQLAPQRVPMGAYVPAATWQRGLAARYRLEGSLCAGGHRRFPPRERCDACGAAAARVPLPRPGTLETFTIVAKGAGPSEFEPLQEAAGEYAVGVASFGGARVPGLFARTPLDALRIGQEVDVVFRRLYAQEGAWRYGLKFRPA